MVDGRVIQKVVTRKMSTDDSQGKISHDDSAELKAISFNVEDVNDEEIVMKEWDELQVAPPAAKAKPWEEESSSESEASSEEGEPPRFLDPPQSLYIDVGDPIKLTCRVAGSLLVQHFSA